MSGLVEQVAATFGWTLARTNMIVEGTSDAALMNHASELHRMVHGVPVLDQNFAVIAAGHGDDGGVDGVSRRLTAMLQIAESDRAANGALRYRFGGLYDNDHAGRTAFDLLSRTDPRIRRYTETFLLHPAMPAIGDGISDRLIEATTLNFPFRGLDWEIEDFCSDRLLAKFERENPGAVVARNAVNGRTHRDIARPAKAELVSLFIAEATIEDARHLLGLLSTLRGYMGVAHDFVKG